MCIPYCLGYEIVNPLEFCYLNIFYFQIYYDVLQPKLNISTILDAHDLTLGTVKHVPNVKSCASNIVLMTKFVLKQLFIEIY